MSVENEKTISENFNNYFVDSIKEINRNIQVIPNQVITIKHNTNTLKFRKVTKQEVLNIIKSFKNKSCLFNKNKQVLLDAFDGDVIFTV